MSDEILFKYRSIQNWKFLLDIFLNQRLYAATYKELNDPMEGRYYYHGDLVSREFKRTLRSQKAGWKICSLSRNHRNTLMWSYYADGHRGIAIGIKVRKPRNNRYIIRNIAYDMDIYLDNSKIQQGAEQVALHILSQKQLAWRHEDEVRVFTHEPFVDVDIRTVCFGYYMNPADRALITALAQLAAPKAEIVQLQRRQLDSPIETFKTQI